MSRYIDADKLRKAVEMSLLKNNHKESRLHINHRTEHIHFLSLIDRTESEDVQPVVHAKFIQVRKESFWCETLITEKCSRCGRKYTRKDIQPQINYCCICGAKMDKE